MSRLRPAGSILGPLLLGGLLACSPSNGTAPPADGWANAAPTRIEQVVERDTAVLLEVSQGRVRTWVSVPPVDAEPGDFVLLGQGSVRSDVPIPELGTRAREVVDIDHVRIVDEATAEHAVRAAIPDDVVSIGTVYAELADRADREVVVHGTVVRAPSAVGWTWVHLQDGTGDAEADTHDLTVRTHRPVAVGQRVTFRGTLRRDVDLGFGYHYAALVESP